MKRDISASQSVATLLGKTGAIFSYLLILASCREKLSQSLLQRINGGRGGGGQLTNNYQSIKAHITNI